MERRAYDRHPKQEHRRYCPPSGLRDRGTPGNTVLVVSGYFKQDATATAADKMMKVLEAEAAAGGTAAHAI